MSLTYWKTLGENIARGLGEKTIRRISTGGRILGRAGTVLGIGLLMYELYKNYKENIEKEPAYKEMMILQEEMEKWSSAISCIGREPLTENSYGSFYEGGAINALHMKETISGQGVQPADTSEACTLIGRSMNYIQGTKNLLEDDRFEENREDLISSLFRLRDKINGADDYGPIQIELAKIVDEMKPIETGYASRIYDCSEEIRKTLGSNAAWAAVSMATMGIVKKPGK